MFCRLKTEVSVDKSASCSCKDAEFSDQFLHLATPNCLQPGDMMLFYCLCGHLYIYGMCVCIYMHACTHMHK